MRIDTVSNSLNQMNAVNQKQDAGTFRSILGNQLDQLDQLETAANDKANAYVSGDLENVTDVLLAIEEFQLTLEMVSTVRNKLVESYQELNRMQL